MRALMLFGVSVALVLSTVAAWVDVALAQDQIAIYRVLPVQVTRDSVLKLAREAFGMDSPTVTENGEGFVLQEGEKLLQVWKVSGALSFTDDSKLWNPDYKPTLLASSAEAHRRAQEFLEKHNLAVKAPGELVFPLGQPTVNVVNTDEGSSVPNHWSVRYQVLLGGLPTVGGAKLDVQLGDRGEVIGLARLWHEVQSDRSLPFFTMEQAQALLQAKLQDARLRRRIEYRGLFYYTGGEPYLQRYVYPVHLFTEIDYHTASELSHLIPATEFTPLAIIVNPKDGQSFPASAMLQFRGQVRFGSPPYRYYWLSSQDGLLSQSAAFSKQLSPGKHFIQLVVADRNGVFNTHTIQIQVSGRSSSPSTRAPSTPGKWWGWLIGGVLILGLLRLSTGPKLKFLIIGLGLLAITMLLSASAPATTQQQRGPFTLGPDPFIYWRIRELGPNVAKDVRWVRLDQLRAWNFFVARHISVPFLEVTVEDTTTKQQQTFRVELDANKAVWQPGETVKGDPLIPGCKDFPVGKRLRVIYNNLPVGVGTGITLNVRQTFSFYWPAWLRTTFPVFPQPMFAVELPILCRFQLLIAPEFYVGVAYKYQGPANFQLKKVRIPIRMDFDVDGSAQDVSVLTKEPFLMVGSCPPFGSFPNAQGGANVCWDKEFGTTDPDPTAAQPAAAIPFQVYHQGNNSVDIPICTGVGRVNIDHPCVHIHLTDDPALGAKFYVVQWNKNEENVDPATLLNREALTNIVLWYVAETNKVQVGQPWDDEVFGDENVLFPLHWAGFTCRISLAPLLVLC